MLLLLITATVIYQSYYASDPEENNHINIPVRKTRSGRNVPFLNNFMVTAFCTTDSFE